MRERIHFTFTYGMNYSRTAFWYQMFQNVVIWVSVINFLISSLPEYWDRDVLALEIIEKVSIGIFTIDYLVRFATVKPGERCSWVRRPLHLFDLAVIVPFYVEVVLKHGFSFNPADASILVIIRALRLFQMFRSVKAARYSSLISVFTKALWLSKDGFVLFSFTITILMVVVSAVMFYAEQTIMIFDKTNRIWRYPNGDVAWFQSIPDTFWWFMVTITTVGYGDVYPKSDMGKCVASLTMVGGLFVLAVPVAVFGSNFTSVWDERQDHLTKRARRRRVENISSLTKTQIVEQLDLSMRRFSIKLNKQKEYSEKLLEEEKEILILISALSKFNLKTKQPSPSPPSIQNKLSATSDTLQPFTQ
uniref:Ion transport domain-containing protein n=2 Tax=Arcella intermedia TaxID=1963864 RepID=A0A6B2L6T6_9EUKA